MLKNYLKIALRNIARYKGFALMNILGLAVGIACVVFIFLWVQDELSYEQFYRNANDIYRLNKQYQIGAEISYNSSTPYPLAESAKDLFAEIKDATRFYRTSVIIKYNSLVIRERSVCYTDESYFNVFSPDFIRGNVSEAFNDPNDIVITEDIAKKYFGEDEAIGKILIIDNDEEYIVSGIIKNVPDNTEIRSTVFIPLSPNIKRNFGDNWGSHFFNTFILLNPGADVKLVTEKLSSLIKEKLPEEDLSLVVQPLKNLHLYTEAGEPVGMKYVYFFTAIALFILLIACINFMNLTTARSSRRAKEVGMRKVIGAGKKQLVYQFFGESFVFAVTAGIIALVLVELLRPAFNDLTGKQLSFSLLNFDFALGFAIVVFLTGLISGIYPAIVLSSFKPVSVLKGPVRSGSHGSSFRKILVVIQFSISIVVIIGAFVIYAQLQFMQERDPGYDTENIVYLRMNDQIRNNYNAFRNKLLSNSNIINLARASELPTETWSIMRGITWEGKETDAGAAFGAVAVDYEYIKTMNIKIAEGRGFSKDFPTDTSNYIFNEKAISIMGFENPVGRRFGLSENEHGKIVGVVKDFNFLPLTYEMEPLMIIIDKSNYRTILVKVTGTDIAETLAHMENVWEEMSPDFPFESRFLNERFERTYSNEVQAGKLFTYFLVITIFISCMGLFGLASFMAEQKTKEIGIRKTLGASVGGLVYLLSRDFMRWVLAANIIAWPVAYYLMSNWLNDFAYRIDIHFWIFIIAGSVALVIALLTVAYQSIKAALANPVKSLRYE
ncbi:ABC transporter permease [Bacteroidota bacterium]